MLEFKRHIVNQDIRSGRCVHKCNMVDLERRGERETNRGLRHLKRQPILCNQGMLLGNDLYE